MASRARLPEPGSGSRREASRAARAAGDDRRLLSGRYLLADAIGAGGMATIFLARQVGAAGFSRLVAVKRLHAHCASEPEFIAMFLDEARLAARVRHPHVVELLDVVQEGSETFIVLEYVHGESLAGLLQALREAGERVPLDVGVGIVSGACRGLHAAHQARGADGAALGIVHRDVSPQNVLIGTDGVARVTDFGVALASGRLSQTRAGQVKGKLAYMAPEQISRDEVTPASDIYAAGVVLWEVCAGRRAYDVANEGALYARVVAGSIPALADVAPWVPSPLVQVVERALRREPRERFASASELADALEAALPPAPAGRIGAFVEQHARDSLLERRTIAARLDPGATPAPPNAAPGAFAEQPSTSSDTDAPSARQRRPLDTQRPITHTLTSPALLRRRSGALVLAFVGAALLTGAVGTGVAWLVLTRPRPGLALGGFGMTVSPPSMFAPASAAPTAVARPQPEPDPAAEAAPDAVHAASPPPPMPDRMQPSQRTSASPAPTSKPCDPPYFIDAAGIRRVKRDCF